jgi:hypothetical protein
MESTSSIYTFLTSFFYAPTPFSDLLLADFILKSFSSAHSRTITNDNELSGFLYQKLPQHISSDRSCGEIARRSHCSAPSGKTTR